MQIRRPDRSKLIRIYEQNGMDGVQVHTIDVTTSDVTFPEPETDGTALTFVVNYQFTPGQEYYILVDGGMFRMLMIYTLGICLKTYLCMFYM